MSLKNTLKHIGFLAAMATMLAMPEEGMAQRRQTQIKQATPDPKFWQKPAVKEAIEQTIFLMRHIQPNPESDKSFLQSFESNPQQLKCLNIDANDIYSYAENIEPGATTSFLSVSKILQDPQIKTNQVSHVVFQNSKDLQGYDMPPQMMAVADLRQLQTEFEKMQKLVGKPGELYIPFSEKMDHTDDRANTHPIANGSIGIILPFGCLVRQTVGSLTGIVAHEVGHHAVTNSHQPLVARELEADHWALKNGYGLELIEGLRRLETTPREMKADDFERPLKPDVHPPTPIRIMGILGYLKDPSITPDLVLAQFGFQNAQPKMLAPTKPH